MAYRSASRQLVVSNNGSIPSFARLEIPAGSPFKVSEGAPASFSVQPGVSHRISLTCCPSEAGEHKAHARLLVAQNPYEVSCVKLSAIGFQADVTVDDLPEGETDTVILPEAVVGQEQQCTFTLTNHALKHFRVSWPSHPSVVIVPPVLHLHAAAKKSCILRFTASVPTALNPADLSATVTEITYSSGEAVEWSKEDMSEAANEVPEPPIEIVKGSEKKLPLKVFAKADHIRFECKTDSISFKATPMFQTRVFGFAFKNTGTVKLDMTCEVHRLDGSLDSSGLYELCPSSTSVEAGQEVKLVVRFKPTEVQDCRRLAVLRVEGLSGDLESPTIQLNGKAQRPWCHFEVLSMYRSGAEH